MKTFLAILTLIPFAALHADSDNPTGSTLQLDTTVTYGSTLSLRGYDSGATITASLVTGISETCIAPLNLSVFDNVSGSLSTRSTTSVTIPGPATTTSGLATSLTKTGNGVLNLIGNSTYSGSLLLSADTGSTSLNLNSVATIGGTLTVGSASSVTINTNGATPSNGTLTLGNTASVLDANLAGNLVIAGSALSLSTVSSGTISVLNPVSTIGGTLNVISGILAVSGNITFPRVTGNGTVTVSGSASVNTNNGLLLGGVTLNAGNVTINGNATTNLYADQTLASLNIANGVTVTFGDGLPFSAPPAGFGSTALASDLAVPEPGSAVLLTLGALALLGKKRRAA